MLKEIFNLKIWQYSLLGNSVKDYLIALVAFLALLLIFRLFQKLILARLKKLAKKTRTDIDDAFIEIVQSVRPPFYSFLAFWLALRFLTLNDFVAKVINAILIIWVVYQIIHALQILINYIAAKKLRDSKATISLVTKILKGILWTFGVLLILSNLGVNITSLIAGLGIGGVAVALAIQNILGDLFSSFAIYLDKPFVVGDFIIIGDDMGTVEKIGIKTTRIRSLQGEEIVISNRELTAARIHNYKKMESRRVPFALGVTYDTSVEKLKKIPEIMKNIIDSIDLVKFDRAHFKEFGDFALIFEIVYYVQTRDYNQYMDLNQEIHFKIKEVLEKENISIAFPTQTIYLEK